jgi:hypothetical protein
MKTIFPPLCALTNISELLYAPFHCQYINGDIGNTFSLLALLLIAQLVQHGCATLAGSCSNPGMSRLE